MSITTILTGVGGAIGCDYNASADQLVFVEYAGKLSAVQTATHAYTVFGTGYTNPEDVKLSTNGSLAYVTERSGDLVRVTLPNAPRSSAVVIATGMTAPQQMALDEARMQAYVVEYAPSGRLFRIDLTTGIKTVIASGLSNAVGVIVKSDLTYAYVSQQGTGSGDGQITRINLATGNQTQLVGGLTQPFFLTWADSTQTVFYFTERGAASRVTRVELPTAYPITYNGDVTFYGKWSLTVVGKSSSLEERVRIAGSLGSDGTVAGVVGNSVAEIDGSAWQAYMESSSDGGVTWYPSLIHRNPSVIPAEGLVVTLNADDSTPVLANPVLASGLPTNPSSVAVKAGTDLFVCCDSEILDVGLTTPDFNDLVVQFVYLNPQVNPPWSPPYGYTLPPSSFRPPRPCLNPPGCNCPCCCQARAKKPPCKC